VSARPERVRALDCAADLAARVRSLDWRRIAVDLDARGNATIPSLLTRMECTELVGLYDEGGLFRSRVVM
jgi:hypothetical protein